jgi:thiol-disulfide isomerase/thioredoxin
MPKFLETKADFDQALAEAGDKLVVVDFTASWCGPCQMIAPKFAAMSEEFTTVLFYKVDVDKNDVSHLYVTMHCIQGYCSWVL